MAEQVRSLLADKSAAAPSLHRSVPQLRHQLQSRQGHGSRLRGESSCWEFGAAMADFYCSPHITASSRRPEVGSASRLSAAPWLVGSRTVNGRYGNIEESQVNCELAAVMYQMVDGLSRHDSARQTEQSLLTHAERPRKRVILVLCCCNSASRLTYKLVELRDERIGLLDAVARSF